VIKIITKIYATRLPQVLSNITSSRQTVFAKGRSIIEIFVVTRQLLHLYKRKNTPAILFKVVYEVFDTINWPYLVNLLIK
jgi:thioredoxin-related protein